MPFHLTQNGLDLDQLTLRLLSGKVCQYALEL